MIPVASSGPGAAVTLLAACAYAAVALPALRHPVSRARWALGLAWLLHAIVLTAAMTGDPPRFGFAPALSMTAWLAVTVYLLESRLYPQLSAQRAPALLAGATVMLAWLFPGSTLSLGSSAWLPLHLALGVASYGLFAMAVAHALLLGRVEHRLRHGQEGTAGLPLLTLERLTFRFISAGFVILSATLLAGMVFGGAGHMRWDHKTVFSLLAWATFVVLLVGRWRLGWRGKVALRFLYAGSALLLLAYVGSRFVIEVVLGRGA